MYKIFFFLLILVTPFFLSADEITDLQNRLQQLNQSIVQINQLLSEKQQQQTSSYEKLILTQNNLENRKQIIATLDIMMLQLQKQIDNAKEETQRLTKEIAEAKEKYKKIILFMYRHRSKENALIQILSSESFGQAYRKYLYLQKYSDYRAKEIQKIITKNRELNQWVNQLLDKRKQQTEVYNQKNKEVSLLYGEQEQINLQIEKLKSEQQSLNKEVEDKQKESEELNRKIRELIQKQLELEKKRKEKMNKQQQLQKTEEMLATNNSFEKNRGKLDWPVEKGVVIVKFGVYDHPLNKRIKLHNNGIQILTPQNADVYVVEDGIVNSIISTVVSNTILVQHGSYFTVYGNIVNLNVKKGDVIKKNTVLGKVATLKTHNKPVLQFELWYETQKIDPALWLKK